MTAISTYEELKQEHDICREALDVLQQSEKSYRTLIENVNIGVYRNTGGPHGRFLQVNPTIVKIFGYDSVEDFMTIAVSDLYEHPEDRKLYIAELLKKGFVKDKEIRLRKKDGTIIWGATTAKIHYNDDGSIKWIDGVIQDITERKAAQEKALKSYHFERTIKAVLQIALEPISLEEQLDRILNLVLEIPFLSLQSKGCVYLVNEETAEIEMKAKGGLDQKASLDSTLISSGRCLCGEAATSKDIIFANRAAEPPGKCFECELPHGQYCIPIKSRDRVHGLINLIIKEGHKRDIQEEEFLNSIANTLAGIIEHKKTEEEKEKLQAQLIQSEKLSALGRMTANVAHEIRNPLTALGGLAKRLGRKIPEESKEKEYTKAIVSEANRLEKILNGVLSYTEETSLHKDSHNINGIVNEALQVFSALHEKPLITIEKALGEVPDILIDKEQVREVLDNLLANAGDALPTGGKIKVVTSKENFAGQPYVSVKMTDTGQGITEEDLRRVFEPFFTTKAVGKYHGIGLGLAISKKIMTEHGGFIRVESEVGKGSTFSLFFPCSK